MARIGLVSRLLRRSIVAPPPARVACRVDWLAGASMMIRRPVLDEAGLFDEAFFLYFEETDLCRRALAAGWSTWYVPESRVAHIGSASTGMKRREPRPAYWFASRRHYLRKHDGCAVTCDDFRQAMAEANGADLRQLERWYSQAGTPTVVVTSDWNEPEGVLSLTLSQSQRTLADPSREVAWLS